MLNITKASAGSGKTYNLTKTYIDLLIKGKYSGLGKDAFKKILAVTFTNKATDEMKSRVLEQLNEMSTEDTRALLIAILNDYSSFNISTIDKFFQKVLRAFAQEVGQYFTYEVELDQMAVLEESIDMMFDSLSGDGKEDLLEWIIALSISAIEEGDSWNTRPKILEVGRELFSEEYRLKLRRANNSGLYYSREQVSLYRQEMDDLMKVFAQKSYNLGHQWIGIMKSSGIDITDFTGGSRTTFRYFERIANKEIIPVPAKLSAAYDDVDAWYSKTSKLKNIIQTAYSAGLNALLGEIIDHYSNYNRYATARVIKKNLYTLGVFNDISTNVQNYCKKKNIVLLADSTQFLNRIIDGSETPFIYERIGSWIDNYMLDEFQDTSRMQWENFRPLLKDSLDRGSDCLIVGDVKQSIYRFRSSDWRLLNNQVSEDFADYQVNENYLTENWRSRREIVEFNNNFFATLINGVADNYDNLVGEGGDLIRDIYSDLKQTMPNKKEETQGHVQVNFVSKDDDMGWQEQALKRMGEKVKELLDAGYKHSDIAVLVRKNSEGSQVANHLVENGFSVVSEDSLLISSSQSVKRIVAVLEGQTSGTNQSVYDICEDAIRNMSDAERTEVAYIQAFLDTVVEYIGKNGSDLNGYLQWWHQTGYRRSISASANEGSITIMTMHKAKGLGFKCVIVPFIYDAFSARGRGNIWCIPPKDDKDFASIGLLPIANRKEMLDTIFAQEYREERLYDYIDTLNVIYVTFTRAKEELVLIARLPNVESKSYKPSSVSDFLYEYCKNNLGEDNVLDFGTLPQDKTPSGHSPASASSSSTKDIVVSIPIGERLRLSLSSSDYFSEDNLRLRGIVLHDILSKISTAADIDKGLEEAIIEGKIAPEDRGSLSEYLLDKLSFVADRHWFDESYTHHNELAIISPQGDEYRPDRIMFKGKEAIIVDYKFGFNHHSSYAKQVQGYKDLLLTCGYSPVTAYLWYVETSEIEMW